MLSFDRKIGEEKERFHEEEKRRTPADVIVPSLFLKEGRLK